MAPRTYPRVRMPRRVVLTLVVLTLLGSLVAPIASAQPGPATPTLEQGGADLRTAAGGPSDGFTDQLVVQMAPRGLEVARARLAHRLPGAGMRALEGFDGAAVVDLAELVPLAEAGELAEELVRSGVVASAEADPAVRTFRVPNDPLWSQQWGPNQRGMPEAWSVTTGGARSPIVAVIDTGVIETSEIEGRVLAGYNSRDGSTDTRDVHGHGTLSATLIAARGDNAAGLAGQCWDCRILPVKALGDDGSGRMSDLAVGVRWAVDNGADIINISAGGYGTIALVTEAVAYAEEQGVTVVASAGNAGENAVAYPAAYPTVLSVAGSMDNGDPYFWTNYGPDVDVAAPGCNVAQRLDGVYGWYCGTSSSAPFVTGILALALDVDAALSASELRARVTDTAEEVGWVRSGIIWAPDVVTPLADGDGPDAVSLQVVVAPDLTADAVWTATSGGTGHDYTYDVHRSLGSSCDDSEPLLWTGSRRSMTDSGLVHGRSYRYCVYARDGSGARSSRSGVATVTGQDATAPPVPTLLGVRPGDRTVTASWTAVQDPTGPVTYTLHRSTGTTCRATSPSVWAGRATERTDTGLTNGTSYRYCVSAIDGAGNRSNASASESVAPSLLARSCFALAGDWGRSGRDGIGWWCQGNVRLRTSAGSIIEYQYGRPGDIPVVADWNGDGRDTISVIRDGTWHLNNDLRGGAASRTFVYGRVTSGDVPLAGRWDGGARSLPAIIRDREWHLRFSQSGGPADRRFIFGRLTAGDLPLWGDWNGNGQETAGVVRSGTWYLRNVHAGGTADLSYVYGRVVSGDDPVVGDWTGDGRDTPGIVRDGIWMLRHEHRGGNADVNISFPAP